MCVVRKGQAHEIVGSLVFCVEEGITGLRTRTMDMSDQAQLKIWSGFATPPLRDPFQIETKGELAYVPATQILSGKINLVRVKRAALEPPLITKKSPPPPKKKKTCSLWKGTTEQNKSASVCPTTGCPASLG